MIYCMEDYHIQTRIGRVEQTGEYIINRRGHKIPSMKYMLKYKTNAGLIDPEEWKKIVKNLVKISDSQELLNRIVEYCRTHCVWLRTEEEREEYALDILAGRIYRHWKNFSAEGLSEKTAFMFIWNVM